MERRLLQLVIGLGCVVPLAAGGVGFMHGPEMLHGVGGKVSIDLDSHFRYLSGLLLGVGVGFASCIPAIETKTGRFRLLSFLVFIGGLGRLHSLVSAGAPTAGHLYGLAMELGAVPLLVLWQARVAALSRAPSSAAR